MIKDLENAIGYRFKNITLLQNALAHSSYANERWHDSLKSNERLEFLGDSILGMVVAEYLYRNFPDRPEGDLTRMRADMVCERSLALIAERIDLGKHLLLGNGEEAGGGRTRDSILADAVESVIAACYLDGGMDAAKEFILSQIKEDIHRIAENYKASDYKTNLQELMSKKNIRPVYEIIGHEGPEHDRYYIAQVTCAGKNTFGKGRSKKEAEQEAAKEMLKDL